MDFTQVEELFQEVSEQLSPPERAAIGACWLAPNLEQLRTQVGVHWHWRPGEEQEHLAPDESPDPGAPVAYIYRDDGFIYEVCEHAVPTLVRQQLACCLGIA
jgi:hypothetical protein